MPDFAYTARNLKGERITGTLSAANEREAISQLAGQSLFPVNIAVKEGRAVLGSNRRVGGQLMAATFAQLAALLRSGVPLLRSLEVMRRQTSHKGLKTVLTEVYEQVEEGSSLSDAMAAHPRAFGEMAVNMVAAGAEGGFLEDALERVAKFTEDAEDLKSRTVGALAYPAFLATTGTLVVLGLVVFFVPRFEEMFGRLRERGELPAVTDWLLWFSSAMQSYGLFVVGGLAIALYVLRGRASTPEGRRLLDLAKLRVPLVGPIYQSLAVARFCRVLGTLLHNGVPILKSLEISRQAAGNTVLSNAIAEASENISAGESLAAPLGESGYFPATVIEMIAVAEESNTLDTVLVEVADSLERRTARKLDLTVRLIEPIMLLILAGMVLVVVIALLLPVIKMSSTI